MRFETILQLPALESGVWRRFAVHVFEGKVTLDDMERMEASGDAWQATSPGKMVELVIIFPSDAIMSSDERARMTLVIKRWERVRVASATVILASGLVGAVHRSVLTGLTMFSPPPHPWKVFGDTAASTRWLAPHVRAVCGDAKVETLDAAIEDLCARLLERRRADVAPRAAR